MPNEIAPHGSIFVCVACGKRSRDRYGYHSVSKGWGAACMLNAVLVREWDLPPLEKTDKQKPSVKKEKSQSIRRLDRWATKTKCFT